MLMIILLVFVFSTYFGPKGEGEVYNFTQNNTMNCVGTRNYIGSINDMYILLVNRSTYAKQIHSATNDTCLGEYPFLENEGYNFIFFCLSHSFTFTSMNYAKKIITSLTHIHSHSLTFTHIHSHAHVYTIYIYSYF